MQMLKTHTLFVNVTVVIDWSMHVRWLTLAQEFEVTESQMLIDFRPVRGVTWSEVAMLPKLKSHRGFSTDISSGAEVDIR